MKQVVGVLEQATRMMNNEGNPRWRLTIAGAGTFTTAPSTQCAFSVARGHVGKVVDVTVDPFGRVFQYAVVPGQRYSRG